MKTNTGVFVLFKTKCELKCQDELFLQYNFSGNTEFYDPFDVIIDIVERLSFFVFRGGQKNILIG